MIATSAAASLLTGIAFPVLTDGAKVSAKF
jgi:hypothetical protein